MDRTFSVISVSTTTGRVKSAENLSGRYISKTPVGAAKKVVTKICSKSKIKGQCTLIVHIREITRDGRAKDYSYKIKRIMNPVTIAKDGKDITFKYTLKATSLRRLN
jgi:hypothetical protein